MDLNDDLSARFEGPFYIKPALLVFCGKFPADVPSYIIERVIERLGTEVPTEIVTSLSLEDFSVDQESLAAQLSTYSEGQLAQEILGQYQGTVIQRDTISLRVIVICSETEDEMLASFLANLGAAVQESLGDLIADHPCLIAFNPGSLGDEAIRTYWPRFALTNSNIAGLSVQDETLLEICQHLTLAVVSSDFIDNLDIAPDKDQPWLGIGASALSTDIASAGYFMQALAFHELVTDLLGRGYSEQERDALLQEAASRIQAIQDALWRQCVGIFEHQGIEVIGALEQRQVNDLRPVFKSDLDLAMTGLEPSSLSPFLQNEYERLRKNLIDKLDDSLAHQLDGFSSYVGFILEPTVAKNVEPSLAQEFGIDIDAKVLYGLQATSEFLHSAVESLKYSPDFLYHRQPVRAFLSGSKDFLDSVASRDRLSVTSRRRWYERFVRRIMTPQGFLVRMLPAWPLLFVVANVILRLLTRWEERVVWLVSAAIVVAIGLVEYFIWKGKADALWERRVEEAKSRLKDSLLRILSWSIREYIYRVLDRLSIRARVLGELYQALLNGDLDAGREVTHYEALPERRDSTTQILMFNARDCQSWVANAMRRRNDDARAQGYDSYPVRLVFELILPILETPRSAAIVHRRYHFEANSIAGGQIEAHAGDLRAYAMASARGENGQPIYPDLAEGRFWQALYGWAVPVGKDDSLHRTFMFFDHPAALGGQKILVEGNLWDETWTIGRSRLPHEVLCIRVVR